MPEFYYSWAAAWFSVSRAASVLGRFWHFLLEGTRHERIVLLSFLPAVGILFIPLQHYMPLARCQHYSFSLMLITAGFALQAGWSWRGVSIWGKLALIGSSLFLGTLSNFLWSNPWLGYAQLATLEQEANCKRFLVSMFIALFPLVVVLVLWSRETLLGSLDKARGKAER